ncbi:MAG: bis(5'-nucleosyl)-tetraphosphatase (symmetrical) YqeK [Eubacteriaceae bacterium]|jgi:ribosome silencing factor RsfS/YbeB/iojap|nr:bis(5'-nucleosyl)-tetraphosphatase (symmetrical) YqeK [Eubacteriaceae bacterium]
MNTESINDYIKEHYSEKRRVHTEGVRTTAIEMAKRFGADPEKAETASLFHDMFRGTPVEDLNRLIDETGIPERYKGNANLAHGKLAAAVMERDWGITDRDILNAVSFHTTGRAGMSQLEKVVFLADAIEPNRDYPGVDGLRKLAAEDLDGACLASLRGTISFLEEQGSFIDHDTVDAMEWFTASEGDKRMETKDIAQLAAEAIDKNKGFDIMIIDIASKSSFADYFVLASGANERQIGALQEDVEDALAQKDVFAKNIEGRKESGWILMDYGDIIVNVLTAEMRERYNIEKVWADCKMITMEE